MDAINNYATAPSRPRALQLRFTPDFILDNGFIVETKATLDHDYRQQLLLVMAHHRALDIRIVFFRSDRPLRKGATTTLADWCVRHGFLYADKLIPVSWLTEPPCPWRLFALRYATA